ncbi:MAG TPA: sigma-70 family RNA polymerase sigma factor [Solirubrobacteraceae bacterium]|nr:sigma-70 family RNA polymerase sigma factor [Solirubrobacteraceae bacterium]
MDANLASAGGALLRVPRVDLRLAGDERLAKMVSNGSDAAFTALFERFQPSLYRYCRSLLGNDADAQDALQTAFTQALVALREGRRTAPVRPWLFRIAHNEAVSLLRRRRPGEELSPEEIDLPGLSADEVAEQRARLATLVADLRALPERQRGALVMRELSGLSHEDIAVVFGISVGAAKQTVLEARRSLQRFTEGRAMSCEEVQRIVSDGDGRVRRDRRIRAHLRDCGPCDSFAAAIEPRREDLRVLSPALPVATAAGLLARITGTGSGHGGGGGAGLVASSAGKAAGMAVSAKAVATGAVAIVAVAAVGAGAIHQMRTRPAGTASGAASRAGERSTSQRVTNSRGAPSARHGAVARPARSTLTRPPARPSQRRHHRSPRSQAAVPPLRSAAASGAGSGRDATRRANPSAPPRSSHVASARGTSHRPSAAGGHGSRAGATARTGRHGRAGSSRSGGGTSPRGAGARNGGTSERAPSHGGSTNRRSGRHAAPASSTAAAPTRPPAP